MIDPKAQWEKVTALNIGNNITLGPIYSYFLLKDPKCLGFVMSRYKFAAKMLKNKKRLIEVGCGEGIGALMLAGETRAEVVGYDFDETQIAYARKNLLLPFEEQNPNDKGRLSYEARDFAGDGESKGAFDGLVCLDVVEHIPNGIMYRRDLLLEMGGYNSKMRHREEEELRKRLGEFYKIHHLRIPMYRYRMHKNNKTKEPEYKDWRI